MAFIFISHSKNEETVKKISSEIKTVNENIFVDFDPDNGLKGGEKWEKQLYIRVRKSRIMIMALSSEWFESEWCYKEYCMARVYKKVIIPVVIEKSEKVFSWDGKDLQHYDFVDDPEAMQKLKNRVEELTRKDIAKLYNTEKLEFISPFPGLRSFKEEEAPFFYGRNSEILNAVNELNSISHIKDKKFLNIIGASGIGKSSFMKAGVLPYLKFIHKDSWFVLPIFRANKNILLSLEDVFFKYVNNFSEKISHREYKQLFDDIERNIKKELIEKNIDPKNLNILFPIDQAEELLISSNIEEKEYFLDILEYLLKERDNFFLIWTIRSDYLKNFQKDSSAEFLQGIQKEFLLSPILMSEIQNVIEEPLYQIKNPIKISQKVIETIKVDLKSTTSLPLLAYLVQQLYENSVAENKKEITLNDYLSLSQADKTPIESIINKKADQIYEDTKDKRSIKKLFIEYLISIDVDKTVSKKSAILSSIPEQLHNIINRFVNERLLIKDKDYIEIAHEALISSWDKLQSWIQEEEEFLIFMNQLKLSYNDWIKSNKSKSALLKGLYLKKALSFKSKINDEHFLEFISKSKNKKNMTIFISIIITMIMIFFILYQWYETDKALKKSQHNIGLVLLEKSKRAINNHDIAEAMLFSNKALEKLHKDLDKTHAIVDAKNILYSYEPIYRAFSMKFNESVSDVILMPDNKSLIVLLKNGNLSFWNIVNGTKTKQFKVFHKNATNLSLGTNNEEVVTISEETIEYWDIKTGKLIKTIDIGFTKDHSLFPHIIYPQTRRPIQVVGDRLYKQYENGIVKVWDLKTKKTLQVLKNTDNFIMSGNGKFAVYYNNKLKHFEVIDIEHNKKHYYEGYINYPLGISNDGKVILTTRFIIENGKQASFLLAGPIRYSYTDRVILTKRALISFQYKKVYIWDYSNFKQRNFFQLYHENINYLDINSTYVITGDEKELKVWDFLSGKKVARVQSPIKTVPLNAKISHDGKIMVSQFDLNDTLTITDMKNNKIIKNIIVPGINKANIAITYDNKKFIVSTKNDIQIFDLHNGELIDKIEYQVNEVVPKYLKLTKNNKYLIAFSTSDKNKEVIVYDLKAKSKILDIELNAIIITDVTIWKNLLVISDINSISFIDLEMGILKGEIFSYDYNIQGPPNLLKSLPEKNVLTVAYGNGNVRFIQVEDFLSNHYYKYKKDYQKILEQTIQAKLDGITLVPTKIPYQKPIWSKNHPFHWLEKAEAGDEEAMYQLGLIYDRDNENEKALFWYKKAANKGHKGAQERVAFLEKWMKEHKQ